MKNKKIFFIVNSSNNGGAIKMLVNLYLEISKYNYDCQLIFIKKVESQYSDIPEAIFLTERLNTLWDYYKAFRRFDCLVKTEKPEAVISFLPLANIFNGIVSKNRGVSNRIASQRNPPYIYGKIVRLIDRYIGSRGFYTANVCNSEAGMNAFSDYPNSYKSLLSVIHNGVEAADFSLSKEQARKNLGIPQNDFVVTCVGRLHEQKNHDLIIKAIKYTENCHFYCAGDGPLRMELESLILSENQSNRITLLGDFNRKQVRTLLRASDVFLIPSKYEGLSNALIEAMSYKLPIICSNIPSFTQFLKNEEGDDALILTKNDEKELGEYIMLLKNNKHLMEEYAGKSIKKVEELTMEKMAFNFLNLLQ